MHRRQFLQSGVGVTSTLALAGNQSFSAENAGAEPDKKEFWPNGARLAISVSMMFEAGGQPDRGAPGPWPPIDIKYPDLPTQKWFEYGIKEGIPRMLDLFDRKKIKVTSHMVGQAVDRYPQLAKEIVERGHEASGHGQFWAPQYTMTRAEQKATNEASIKSIEKATGTRPLGYNGYYLRGTADTLEVLQELGFIYHIDDISRDEPFTVQVKGKPFAVVPYTADYNDMHSLSFTSAAFGQEMKDAFDVLYEEGAKRRRMFTISCHDRLSGHPARIKALADFIDHCQKQKGVWFARKDEIARFALESPITIHEK
jgi:peptidoglycan/xylan/chitin deacetylase (PgdA/CDA1 family)